MNSELTNPPCEAIDRSSAGGAALASEIGAAPAAALQSSAASLNRAESVHAFPLTGRSRMFFPGKRSNFLVVGIIPSLAGAGELRPELGEFFLRHGKRYGDAGVPK